MAVIQADWVWTGSALLQHAQVVIADGRITAVRPAADHRADEMLSGKLLLPGLVNAHSHAFQRAFRGHVQHRASAADDFWSWREAMYGVATTLSPEGIEAVSRLAFVEMIEAGITAVGEFHYLQYAPDGSRYADPDELARRVIRAATDVGLRIALLRVAYAAGDIGKPLGEAQLRFGDRSPDEVMAAIERLRNHPDERVSVGLAPHSVRAVPIEWLTEFRHHDGVIHSHVAEQPREVAACRAAYGKSPLQVLDDAGLVGPSFCAVHLTCPEPGDVDLIAERKARVCACPSTEMDLGDGFLPLSARGLSLCIGSDSQAVIEPLAEARALEMHARALAGRRNVMVDGLDRHALAERLLRIASSQGAAAIGLAEHAISVGAHADLVAIDLHRPEAVGVPPLEAAALVATPAWISEVWIAGNQNVKGGRHPDRDAIITKAMPFLSSSGTSSQAG